MIAGDAKHPATLPGPRRGYAPLPFTICLDSKSAALIASYGLEASATWTQRRDGLIVRVLLATGLRRAELAGLTEKSIRPWGTQPWLYIVGKGGRCRWVPLHPFLVRERKSLFESISSSLSRPSILPFIPSVCGQQLRPTAPRTVYDAVARASLATLGNKIHPHTLRHTCASLMLSTRAPLSGVQGILGHSDLRTTARYLHLLPETLLAAASDDFYAAIGIEAGIHHRQQSIRFPMEAVQ